MRLLNGKGTVDDIIAKYANRSVLRYWIKVYNANEFRYKNRRSMAEARRKTTLRNEKTLLSTIIVTIRCYKLFFYGDSWAMTGSDDAVNVKQMM